MEPAFNRYDFTYNQKEYSFIREIDDGKQSFYFLINEKTDGIYIEPRWAIQITSMLNVYHQITLKDKASWADTTVLDNSLGQLIEYIDENNENGSGKRMRYLIAKDEDVEILQKVIPIRFEEYVLPYFNKNSSIERIDELLNTSPQRLVIHHWLNPHRAIMGIIAAKLNNNPKLDELIMIYGQKLEKAAPNYQKEFENLIRLLRHPLSTDVFSTTT